MIGVRPTGNNSGGGAIDQDNKNKVVHVGYPDGTPQSLYTRFAAAINTVEKFTLNDKQSVIYVLLPMFSLSYVGYVSPIYKFVTRELGKGEYGFGATQVGISDLELIYKDVATVSDIESALTTQIQYIDNLLGMSIAEFVGQSPEAFEIQQQESGATLFKVGEAGSYNTYWFIGNGGTYGYGLDQPTDADFELLSEFTTVTPTPKKPVLIQSKDQLKSEIFRSDAIYIIDGYFHLEAGEFVNLANVNTTFEGYGYDVSGISKDIFGESVIKSAVGGCANLSLNKLEINSGASHIFDLVDSNGTHAIEMNDVNFQNCSSMGRARNFRQFTGSTLGAYGCGTGLQFSGTWNGVKLQNSNCFAFGSGGTFFRKDTDTLFKNRFYAELNADFPLGAKLADFVESNFASDELFQMNSSMIKYNGTSDDRNAAFLIPSLSANNRKCLWRSNVGLPDTAIEKVIEDTNVNTAFVVSWLYDTYLLTMTGNTIFSETNLPASGKNTEEIKIYLQGNFTPTFPNAWNANKVGTFKLGELNQITLKYLKQGLYFMKIDNSLTVYPAPNVSSVSPVSMLPSTTTSEFIINGSFFTPATIVSIEGHQVNSIEFINQGQLKLNVTTSILEGTFDLIISNGTSVTIMDKVVVILGTTYEPTAEEWVNIAGTPNLLNAGNIKATVFDETQGADWKVIPANEDFRVQMSLRGLFLDPPRYDSIGDGVCQLIKTSDNSIASKIFFRRFSDDLNVGGNGGAYVGNELDAANGLPEGKVLTIERKLGIWRLYMNTTLVRTFSSAINDELLMRFKVRNIELYNIRYIKLG